MNSPKGTVVVASPNVTGSGTMYGGVVVVVHAEGTPPRIEAGTAIVIKAIQERTINLTDITVSEGVRLVEHLPCFPWATLGETMRRSCALAGVPLRRLSAKVRRPLRRAYRRMARRA